MARHDAHTCIRMELLLQLCFCFAVICAMIPALPGMRYGDTRALVYALRTAWRGVPAPGHEAADWSQQGARPWSRIGHGGVRAAVHGGARLAGVELLPFALPGH